MPQHVHFPIEQHTFFDKLPKAFRTLPKAFATCCEIMRDTWIEAGKAGEIMPAIFMGFKARTLYTAHLQWRDDNEKARLKAMLRAFCYENKIEYYCFGSEVWIRQGTKKGQTTAEMMADPEIEANKLDGFFVIGIGKDRSPEAKLYKSWVRLADGTVDDHHPALPEQADFEGEMTEFLLTRGSDKELHMAQVNEPTDLTDDQRELLGDLVGFLAAAQTPENRAFDIKAKRVLGVVMALYDRLKAMMPSDLTGELLVKMDELVLKTAQIIAARDVEGLDRIEGLIQESYDRIMAMRGTQP